LINLAIFGINFLFMGKVIQNQSSNKFNTELSENLDRMSQRADSLAHIISKLHSVNSDIRDFADLPQLDASDFSYGIGGPELDILDPDKPLIYARAKEIDRKLDSLIVAARAENKSIEAAKEHFVKRSSVFDHTPSIWPMRGYVSSGFGKRLDPFTGLWKMHEGIDICARKGTPVRATADGKVRFSGWYHGYGKTVKINHSYYETHYAHLEDIKVRPGQSVKRGDIIGTCGNSGNTTGVHLHYEVRVSGRPVDPKTYITPEVVVD